MSKVFISWLKDFHPEILLIFVPANCTSVFQPGDVILQRPFKHSFRQQFDMHTSQDIGKQLDERDLEEVKLKTKMTALKPLICSWLHQAWQDVNKPSMIKKGWAMCGLDRAFHKVFQTNSMDENMKIPLFKEMHMEVENDQNEKKEETDTDLQVESIMDDSLTKITKITAINKRSSVSSLRDLARKR
jgi:hypothetical protein